MKRQSVGIVLSALLLTTFGHEILTRHQLAHSERQSHLHARSHFGPRAETRNHCTVICERPGDDQNLTIALNVTTGLAAAYNASAGVALIIDINAHLVGIFNQTSGSAIIIDIVKNVAVEVTGVWSIHVEFKEFFSQLVSLKVLYERGHTIKLSAIGVQVRLILILLSNGELTVPETDALNIFISAVGKLTVNLKFIIRILTGGVFSVKISLRKLVEVISGLAEVLGRVKGGIDVIIEHHVKINLQVLLSAKSALEVTGYILGQLFGADLQHILGNLNTTVDVLELIATFADNSTDGVNGVVHIFVEIVLLVDGKGSIQAVIAALVEFLANNKDRHTVGEEWRSAVDGLYDLIVKLHLEGTLKVVFNILTAIRERKWQYNGVDLSEVIQVLLFSNNLNPLNIILNIFVILKVKVTIEVAVANLVLYLIELLVVRGGINIVVIICEISVSQKYIQAGENALKEILQGIRVQDLLSLNLCRILQHLPVIGSIITRIDATLKDLNLNITVSGVLQVKVSGQVVVKLSALLVKVVKSGTHVGPITLPIPIFGNNGNKGGSGGGDKGGGDNGGSSGQGSGEEGGKGKGDGDKGKEGGKGEGHGSQEKGEGGKGGDGGGGKSGEGEGGNGGKGKGGKGDGGKVGKGESGEGDGGKGEGANGDGGKDGGKDGKGEKGEGSGVGGGGKGGAGGDGKEGAGGSGEGGASGGVKGGVGGGVNGGGSYGGSGGWSSSWSSQSGGSSDNKGSSGINVGGGKGGKGGNGGKAENNGDSSGVNGNVSGGSGTHSGVTISGSNGGSSSQTGGKGGKGGKGSGGGIHLGGYGSSGHKGKGKDSSEESSEEDRLHVNDKHGKFQHLKEKHHLKEKRAHA